MWMVANSIFGCMVSDDLKITGPKWKDHRNIGSDSVLSGLPAKVD